MKKYWKKIVMVLAILLLSVAGYLLYIFQFKEYETADENVDKVVQEEYKVELPDGSTIILDKEGNVVEDSNAVATTEDATTEEATESDTATSGSTSNTPSAGDTSAGDSVTTTPGTGHSSSNGSSSDQTSGSKNSSGTAGSTGSATGDSDSETGSGSSDTGSSNTGSADKESAGTETGGVTVASIKQKYEPTLADIEGQATSRINGLIGAAQSEYATKKGNGENINYAYFYNKYMGAATELENRTDTVFYAVIGSLKNDLKANKFAASHVDSFISEYEARKEARKKELISKASGM